MINTVGRCGLAAPFFEEDYFTAKVAKVAKWCGGEMG